MKAPSNLRALAIIAAIVTTQAQAILDTNNNGMSDLFERQYNNGNLFSNTFLATNDDDKDGWTNAMEAIAGTNPFEANPPDGIVTVTITPSLVNGAFTLTWPTLVGKNYQVQFSTDLLEWTNLGASVTTTQNIHSVGVNTTQPDNSIAPKIFWQVVVSDLDYDEDGLTNAEEYALGTNPWLADSDEDGVSDQLEIRNGTNPSTALDLDNDGIADDLETHLAMLLLEYRPDPTHWGTYYAGLAAGNLDANHDYTADGMTLSVLARILKTTAQVAPSESGYHIEIQIRHNRIPWAIHTPPIGNSPAWSDGTYWYSEPNGFGQTEELDSFENFTPEYLTSRIGEVEWSADRYPPLLTYFYKYGAVGAEAASGFLISPEPPSSTRYRGFIRQYRYRIIASRPDHPILDDHYLKLTKKFDYGNAIGNGELLAGESFTHQLEQGRMVSEWYELSAPMVNGQETLVSLASVDLDFIKPGTENEAAPVEIAEDKEDSEGEVVNVNWDDDNDSEGDGGHAKLVFKNDFDDTIANGEEDDMIQLKLHRVNADGAKAKLKYDSNFVKIWRNENRTDAIISESTDIDVTETKIVYLEGRKLTAAESPTIVEMLVKTNASEDYQLGDKVSVHVATPILTFQSKINWVNGAASKNLAEQMHDKQYLGKYRRDDRSNTVILKGKNQQGSLLWYSVDIVDIRANGPLGNTVGDNENLPIITIRTPKLDKEFKMALSLAGAHIMCNGHSNYGLGPNFTPGGTTTVDDYTNLSGRGITAITMKSTDPQDGASGNPMLNIDHGGPNFALRESDILTTTQNYIVPIPGVLKFDGQPNGAILTKQVHSNGTPFHYLNVGNFQNWNTIVKSSGDVPTLRYASCFMASCNTGRAFSETIKHGVFLYTLKTSQMQLGRDNLPILGDKTTATPRGRPKSWVDAHYVRMMVEGKSWNFMCTFLNQNYSYPWPKDAQGNPVTPSIYTYEP